MGFTWEFYRIYMIFLGIYRISWDLYGDFKGFHGIYRGLWASQLVTKG